MNRKAQGIESIKTLIFVLIVGGVILLLVFVLMHNINKSASSNLCLASISLVAQNKGDLNCARGVEFLKKSDFDDANLLKKKIASTVVSCSSSVGMGKVNPFIKDTYKSRSNCLVCSDMNFESNGTVDNLIYWSALNNIPGSKTETFFRRMTGKEPSTRTIEILQSLNGYGKIDASRNYSVFWKVDSKNYWDNIFDGYLSNEPVKLLDNKMNVVEYKIIGNKLDESVIVGEDFFGFVVNVDEDKEFVSSVWVAPDDFVLSAFDISGDVNVGSVCYYVHN